LQWEAAPDLSHWEHANISTQHRQLSANFWKSLKEKSSHTTLENILLNHTDYVEREPFPHAVIDGIFPMSLLHAVTEEVKHNSLTFSKTVSLQLILY
jgi:hypothetical protein